MQTILLLLAAIAPVAVLLFYIYKKDSAQPEPPKWLWKGFCYGIGSIFLSFCFSIPLSYLLGYGLAENATNIVDAAMISFFTAAIPEELAKLIMLWLLLRKNPFFDERIDGVVYAVCVGMGFACLENIIYVFEHGMGNAAFRAFTAVPGHFLFAVVMGYFYSLFYFTGCKNKKTMILVIAAPVIAHGLYDTICFTQEAILESYPILSFVLLLSLFFFIYKLGKYGSRRIAELQANDRKNIENTCA